MLRRVGRRKIDLPGILRREPFLDTNDELKRENAEIEFAIRKKRIILLRAIHMLIIFL